MHRSGKLPDDPGHARRGNVWAKATNRTSYFLVHSKVTWFMGHWSAARRRSIRCGGEICALCAGGAEARPFMYVGVIDGAGERRILELNRRHRPLADMLAESPGAGIGSKLALRKEGTAKNSPITIVHVGYEDCEPQPIDAFVGTLGEPSVLIPAGMDSPATQDQSETPGSVPLRTSAM